MWKMMHVGSATRGTVPLSDGRDPQSAKRRTAIVLLHTFYSTILWYSNLAWAGVGKDKGKKIVFVRGLFGGARVEARFAHAAISAAALSEWLVDRFFPYLHGSHRT